MSKTRIALDNQVMFHVFETIKKMVIKSDKPDNEKIRDILRGLFKLAYKLKNGNVPTDKQIEEALEGIE